MRPLLVALLLVLLAPAAASAAGLTDPAQVTTSVPAEARAKAAGLLPDGTAGSAYLEQVGGAWHVRASVRAPGGTWSEPADLGAAADAAAALTPVVRAGDRLVLAFGRTGGGIVVAELASGGSAWKTSVVSETGAVPAVDGSAAGYAVGWVTPAAGAAIARAGATGAAGAPQEVPGETNVSDVAVGIGGDGVATLLLAQNSGSAAIKVAQRPADASFASGPTTLLELKISGAPPFGTSYGIAEPVVADAGDRTDLLWTTTTYSFPALTSTKLQRVSLARDGTHDDVATLDQGGGSVAGAVSGLSAAVDPTGRTTASWTTGVDSSRVARGAVRPAGADAFGTATDLAPASMAPQPALAASGPDALVIVDAGPSAPAAAVRRTGDAFEAPLPLGDSSRGQFAVGGDGRGQFVLAYQRTGAGVTGGWTRFYDAVGPTVGVAATPASGVAPLGVSLTATATDPLSPVGSVSWAFGDGAAAAGSPVSHAYGAGSFTAAASVTDAAGNTGTGSATVTATAPATSKPPVVSGPPVSPPAPKPQLSKLALTRRGVRVTVSTAAKLTVTVKRRTCKRVRGKRRCKVARRGVTRRVSVAKAGAVTARLKVRRGQYRVTVRAANAAGKTTLAKTLRRQSR